MVRHQSKRAFTLAEILISMALLGMLLASVAVAMKATVSSYTENDEMAAVTQTGRVILSKMTKEIRTAVDVNSNATTLTILPVLDGSGLTQIQYQFQNGTLTYLRTVGGVQTSSVLLGSTDRVQLTSFTAAPQAGTDSKGQACTVAMTMTLTFALGDQTFSVTASAAPRQNQSY